MDDNIIYISNNMASRIERILSVVLITVFSIGPLLLIFAGWGYFATIPGIAILPFAAYNIVCIILQTDRRLVITHEGIYIQLRNRQLQLRLKQSTRLFEWKDIEKVIVYRAKGRQTIKQVLVVGHHKSHISFDMKRGVNQVRAEPRPWRPLIGISGKITDIAAIIQYLQDRLPDQYFEEEYVAAWKY